MIVAHIPHSSLSKDPKPWHLKIDDFVSKSEAYKEKKHYVFL